MENIKNKSNSELEKIKKDLADEFEKVRKDLIKIYDYWVSIEKKSSHIISYTFSLYERIIKVQFIDCFNMNNQKNELYNTYVETILVWLYIVNKYASKECSDELDIYLYFTQNMKNLYLKQMKNRKS